MKFNNGKLGEILGIALATVIFATLTLPVLKYSGVLDLLQDISIRMTNFVFGY